MKFPVRLLLSFLLFFLFSLLVTTKTFAQTLPATNSAGTTESYAAPNTNPDVPKNLHTWTQNVMIETMAALTCQLAGIDPVNPNQKCLGVDQKTGQIGFVENGGGAIGLMGNAIAMLYTPPASSGDYFQNLASNFGIAKPAQAQGTGFQSLKPLLGIWTAFRNITYLLFVLVFVVVGLAIMLRIKIDPRTVMTVQNQIPKIIVGLILVTFSFAIAGFLIDIMYTSIYLTGNAIAATSPKTKDSSIVTNIARSTNTFSAANKIGGLGDITLEPSKSISGFMVHLFNNSIGRTFIGALVGAGGATGGAFLGGPIGLLVGGVVGGIVGAGIGPQIIGGLTFIIAFLVILIAIIWALFRLWFALISAYIFLLLDIIFAPLWIFAGLLPGSPISFNLWIRDIVANLAAFPTAIVMFIIGKVAIDAFATTGPAFSPPMVGLASSPSALGSIIGLGFILLTPRVVQMTKGALKAPKFDTTPIKQAIGVGTGSFTSLPGRAGQIGLMLGGMKNIPGLRNIPGIREGQRSAAETSSTPTAGH